MCKFFALACLLFMAFVALLSCKNSEEKHNATHASAVLDSANAATPEETSSLQYMAVCTTKEEHGGNEYILTKWLDDKHKAEVFGREHLMKKKAHYVIYRTRVRPE